MCIRTWPSNSSSSSSVNPEGFTTDSANSSASPMRSAPYISKPWTIKERCLYLRLRICMSRKKRKPRPLSSGLRTRQTAA